MPTIAFRSSFDASRTEYPLAFFAWAFVVFAFLVWAIPTIMLPAREARDQDAAARTESRRADRTRRQGDVAELHPLLSLRHGTWPRLLGHRRGWQQVPRLHRRHRGRHDRPLPPEGGRRH